MEPKHFVFGLVSVVALGGAMLFMQEPRVVERVVEKELGAASGPDHYEHQFFQAGITVGGGIRATSTTGAVVPLVASDFNEEKVIDVTLNQVDATLSFPASSTLASFAPRPGDVRTIYVRNATTTSTMDLTISGGTGVLMKQATSTGVMIPGDTDGANFARLDLIRKANGDFELLVEVFKD